MDSCSLPDIFTRFVKIEEKLGIDEPLPLWARAALRKLISLIEGFKPDVVILTARKMPRLCEGLDICFRKDALIISDLAIPFCADNLANARIAIVDDVVNYGSTLKHVASTVNNYGPAAIRLFSLGFKSTAPKESLVGLEFANAVPLSPKDYKGYVRSIPEAVSYVPKPYDLNYPLLPTRYRMPFSSSSEIITCLSAIPAWEVHTVPSPYANCPNLRASLLFVNELNVVERKIRLYFDDKNQICSVVPMVVPQPLPSGEPAISLQWVRDLAANLRESVSRAKEPEASDARATIGLFTSSLDWFWATDIREHLANFLDFTELPFCANDAKSIFGPTLTRSLAHILNSVDVAAQPKTVAGPPPFEVSPFIRSPDLEKLVLKAAEKLPKCFDPEGAEWLDCYAYMLGIVQALSELVGAEDPSDYSLTWPFKKEDVLENPYLRLRIGPTLPDIAFISQKVYKLVSGKGLLPKGFYRSLSLTLDALVDQGAIVPTFATYDGTVYRIYRKGEGPGQDVCDKVVFSLAVKGKPISPSRLAKLLAVMSHSEKYHDVLRASARTRGMIAGVHKSALGAEPENIPTYLRNTGQLQPIK